MLNLLQHILHRYINKLIYRFSKKSDFFNTYKGCSKDASRLIGCFRFSPCIFLQESFVIIRKCKNRNGEEVVTYSIALTCFMRAMMPVYRLMRDSRKRFVMHFHGFPVMKYSVWMIQEQHTTVTALCDCCMWLVTYIPQQCALCDLSLPYNNSILHVTCHRHTTVVYFMWLATGIQL